MREANGLSGHEEIDGPENFGVDTISGVWLGQNSVNNDIIE